MTAKSNLPWGYKWRSSQSFIITTATISLFSECFLFGFIVPILPYMLEQRLNVDPSQTQTYTTTLLTIYGLISLLSAPFIAHYADKTPHRKLPLLISLTACSTGTILVATSRAIWVLMAGQVLQSLASASVWVVAMATLVDNLDSRNKGKVLGASMSVVGTGIFAGPALSGVLLELVGYWAAWSGALVLLAVDFGMRVVMIDNRAFQGSEREGSGGADGDADEETRLLSEHSDTTTPTPASEEGEGSSTSGFYKIMLSNPRILASLANTLALSLILASFDTTLPLHVRAIFNWGSLPVGLIFFGLQAPSICLGPVIGWLRDRVGLRVPTTIAWAAMAPLLWVMAVPGEKFAWGQLDGDEGRGVYIGTIVALGFAFSLTRGAGTFQMMTVVHELESTNPQIFGPYGGNSRLSGLTEVPFNLGMMLGPLISGSFSELVGYYWSSVVLACISFLVAVSSWMYLTAAPVKEKGVEREDLDDREVGEARMGA
ncbi:MFS transporter [Aspergillus stella-maris]|uniref:MFS transporter n=1 Tax=Aspergillus stella-maris TaxID=1810926 RepID=UPI003CCDFB86